MNYRDLLISILSYDEVSAFFKIREETIKKYDLIDGSNHAKV